MSDTTGRRRFLELAATGATLGVAGCSALGTDGDGPANETSPTGDPSDVTDTTGTGGADAATVGVVVQPDQEALQQRQSEVQSEIVSGNMSRQAAQETLRQAELELTLAAVEAFKSRVADDPGLTVEDTIPEFGAVLVTGAPSALIGLLSVEKVGALLPEADFEAARQQANQSTDQQGNT